MTNPFVGAILLCMPTLVIGLWNLITIHRGDVLLFFSSGKFVIPECSDPKVWAALFGFMIFQVVLMKLVPGPHMEGPVSEKSGIKP